MLTVSFSVWVKPQYRAVRDKVALLPKYPHAYVSIATYVRGATWSGFCFGVCLTPHIADEGLLEEVLSLDVAWSELEVRTLCAPWQKLSHLPRLHSVQAMLFWTNWLRHPCGPPSSAFLTTWSGRRVLSRMFSGTSKPEMRGKARRWLHKVLCVTGEHCHSRLCQRHQWFAAQSKMFLRDMSGVWSCHGLKSSLEMQQTGWVLRMCVAVLYIKETLCSCRVHQECIGVVEVSLL